MDYKKLIYECLSGIDNEEFLEIVYRFVKRIKENWGI